MTFENLADIANYLSNSFQSYLFSNCAQKYAK